jgi:hypothetical protein
MVSTKWTSTEQRRRTVNLGGTAGTLSRPNVDGSFYLRR